MKLFVFVAGVFISNLCMAALPAPSDIPKDGNCPAGYSAKGEQCIPGGAASFVVVKSGDCPEDYVADGNYCVATKDAKLAIRRAAMSCPSGFESAGNYCVSKN